MSRYVGKAALSLVRTSPNGAFAYVYEGDVVPENAESEHLERLVDRGYLVKVKDADVSGLPTAGEAEGDVEPDKPARRRN